MTVVAREREREAPRCPFCRDSILREELGYPCPACATRHHLECFRDNGGCTVLGCSARAWELPLRVRLAFHARRPRGVAASALLAVGVATGVFLLGRSPAPRPAVSADASSARERLEPAPPDRAEPPPITAFSRRSPSPIDLADPAAEPLAVERAGSSRVVVASRSGAFTTWDLATGRAVRAVHAAPRALARVAFAPGGQRSLEVLEGSRDSVRIRDVETGDVLRAFGAPGRVESAAISADGRRVAFVVREGALELWDVDRLARIGRIAEDGVEARYAFASTGALVVATRGALEVRDEEGRRVRELATGEGSPIAVAVSPSGLRAAVALHGERSMHVYDLRGPVREVAALDRDATVRARSRSRASRRSRRSTRRGS